jgi:alpha-beta hydrolase superfamily lysophospholipase
VEDLRDIFREARTVKPVAASYGRLSAFDFAVPLTRRRNLRWFRDQYSYQLSKHPDLPFHFVGHSNGTYLFGQSIDTIRAMRFDRVFLAGSVLPRDFSWPQLSDSQRIGTLINACASKDVPVGWLCSLLRGLGMRDIGVGGFVGFDNLPDTAEQQRHIRGAHSAALSADQLPAIADYVRTGKVTTPTLVEPSTGFAMVSRVAPAVPWILLAGLATALVITSASGPLLWTLFGMIGVGLVVIVLKVV